MSPPMPDMTSEARIEAVARIDAAKLEHWTEQARRDDWHTTFVGSDIRIMLGEIKRFRAALAAADSQAYAEALEEAARIVRGTVVHERYRTWAHFGRGNRDKDSEITRHCDALADAIRALPRPPRADG